MVALGADRILISADTDPRELVGSCISMPTLLANEVDSYRVKSVSTNRETGDHVVWLERDGDTSGGRHARIVTRRP